MENVIYNSRAPSSYIGFLQQQSPDGETAAFMCWLFVELPKTDDVLLGIGTFIPLYIFIELSL
ncbi:hypothetical protein ABEW32_22145 [Paenibacillus jamilae]|uniref:hypothetical protein n=1 Tax=Paenibacillus jamilae TaxID=114136 RepID=UPI003D2A3B5B